MYFLILILKILFVGSFLRNNTILLIDGAIQSIGILGKTYGLPLPDDGEDEFNKKAIVEILFSTLSNAKMNTKVRFVI